MTEEIQRHFERAAECVEDARILFQNARFVATVARAYYAMFHAATAALLARDVRRSSHHALLSAFGLHLIKTGCMDRIFFENLREAFESRQQTDYEPIVDIDQQAAKDAMDRAVNFVDACRKSVDRARP